MATTQTTKRTVKLSTRTVGTNFGRAGVVTDARTGKKLAESDETFPLGNGNAAYEDARRIAERKGWTVVEDAAE